MKRKTFIRNGSILGAMALIQPAWSQETNKIFSAEEITEFVFAAHKDLEETQKIVEKKPLLLNCTNQFKKGDFETALGGASHMGRRDIADMLVAKGARLDLFNYTFLGYSDFVKKFITDYPHFLRAPGPHGFTLLHHAKVGGHTDMETWLMEKGLSETHIKGVFG